jgi:hypothetical protein
VNVPDTQMLAMLEARDGPLPERSWSHASEGECRYAELYENKTCPWCTAEKRRQQPDVPAGA